MASTTDIKNGAVLKIDGNLWSVVEFQHVKPGKGGAFVRTKLRNVTSGKVVDRTFNAGAKIETATVDRSDYQYLYQDGDDYVFMDMKTYDQINVPATVVGAQQTTCSSPRPQPSQCTRVAPCTSSCPHPWSSKSPTPSPACRVTAPPVHQAATVETGYEIQVPLFLETGTKVKVDTRTGEYLGRVND